MPHTVIALLQDHPGAFSRAVSLFRHGGHVHSLAIAATERPGVSRLTMVVHRAHVERIVQQLNRLAEVVAIRDVTLDRAEAREARFVGLAPPVQARYRSQADGFADEEIT